MNQKGAKFQIIRFPTKASIGPHYHHKVCEIFYVLKGEGTFVFNGERYSAKPNDFFLNQPGDVHEITNEGEGELVILIFKTNEDERDIVWVEK